MCLVELVCTHPKRPCWPSPQLHTLPTQQGRSGQFALELTIENGADVQRQMDTEAHGPLSERATECMPPALICTIFT